MGVSATRPEVVVRVRAGIVAVDRKDAALRGIVPVATAVERALRFAPYVSLDS